MIYFTEVWNSSHSVEYVPQDAMIITFADDLGRLLSSMS